jgi:hypothetical protein
MHRYVDVSDFRAPFDSPQLDLAGEDLAGPDGPDAPAHRYVDVSNYRSPYDHRGYFQDNTLFGLGAESCPDPVKNPYTVGAAACGVFVGLVVGFVAARIMR